VPTKATGDGHGKLGATGYDCDDFVWFFLKVEHGCLMIVTEGFSGGLYNGMYSIW
jgi:hypothetical protein